VRQVRQQRRRRPGPPGRLDPQGYVVAAQKPSALEVTLQRLTPPAARAEVSVCDEPPDSPAVERHTHDFDQFYYLLRGGLSVEVGQDEHHASERTLVMMPAGIPHGSANRSGAPVRYLVVNVPAATGDPLADLPTRLQEAAT